MGGASSITIGYKYYLSMAKVVCQKADAILGIYAGEREAWTGEVTTNSTISINQPELFGGKKSEGGLVGDVDIMFGGATQPRNTYLQSVLGSNVPAFRGLVTFVLKNMYIAAMSPYPKAWSIKLRHIPASSWYPAKANINGGANAAHIIYFALTDPDVGLGLPTALIDNTSFTAVADKLYTEGLGLSFVLSGQESAEDLIQMVLSHVDGMIYVRPTDNKFVLKLIRDDYVLGSTKIFDESNCVLEAFDRPGYGELVNEVIIVYRPQGTADDDSVTLHDLASIQAQQGIISETINLQGIDSSANASRIAARELKRRSNPYARARIRAKRYGYDVNIGDVIRVTNARRGIVQMPMRVLNITRGTLKNRELIFDLVEDVFSLLSTTYMGNQDSEWTNPIVPPTALSIRRVEEANYWDVARSLGPAVDNLDLASSYLVTYMGEPSYYASNYDLWTRPAGGTYSQAGTGNFVGYGALSADITPAQTSFTLTGLSKSAAAGIVESSNIFCLIDDEIVRLDSFNPSTGAVTVGRGCLDTVPRTHLTGARFWFAETGKTRDPFEYLAGETVNAKALTRTIGGLLDISLAPEDSKVMAGRAAKPWPVGRFQVKGQYYPPTAINGNPMSLSWVRRDHQLMVVKPIRDHTYGDMAPDCDRFRVDVYEEDGVTLLKTEDLLASATSWTWATEAADVNLSPDSVHVFKVTAEDTVNVLENHQSASWSVIRAGLGYNLGNYLGGV